MHGSTQCFLFPMYQKPQLYLQWIWIGPDFSYDQIFLPCALYSSTPGARLSCRGLWKGHSWAWPPWGSSSPSRSWAQRAERTTTLPVHIGAVWCGYGELRGLRCSQVQASPADTDVKMGERELQQSQKSWEALRWSLISRGSSHVSREHLVNEVLPFL